MHVRFILSFPMIWLLGKSSDMAMQTVLHALFLPTPFKRALAHLAAATAAAAGETAPSGSKEQPDDARKTQRLIPDAFTEILKPGALYRECSVVTLRLPPLPLAAEEESSENDKNGERASQVKKSQKKGKDETNMQEEVLDIEDDGEYGGEKVGRLAWEWFEVHLKAWEAKEKEEEKETTKTEKSAATQATAE